MLQHCEMRLQPIGRLCTRGNKIATILHQYSDPDQQKLVDRYVLHCSVLSTLAQREDKV